MRENQNIAHCSVCSEKTHCRFSHAYIPHRLHSTESNFQLFLSQNLPNNMGDICMILIQNGRRFITHSPTISRLNKVFQWLYEIKDSKLIQSVWKKDVCWHSLGNLKKVLQFVCFQNETLWSKDLTEYCIDNAPGKYHNWKVLGSIPWCPKVFTLIHN